MRCARVLTATLLLVIFSGCASKKTLNDMEFSTAEPLTRLQGEFNNVYRDDQVYFAGQPTIHGLLDMAKRQNVKTVVNIRTEAEMTAKVGFEEQVVVEGLGMSYVHIPVTPDTFSADDADCLHEVLGSTSDAVLLHCGSSNRVGGLWALYLHRHRGVPLEEAIEYGRSAGLRKDSMVEAVRGAAGVQP